MTYSQAVEKINSLLKFGSRPGLDRIETLLDKMGRPQDKTKFIHVAGTNGKGSVCTILSGVLRAAGYKTGLFLSPFIIDFRERIQIDGEMIPEQALCEITGEIMPLVEEMAAQDEIITEFELVTAIAFEWYARSRCDAVVLETGLGGLLDCTNVIGTPLASVVTSISLDHTELLGNTIREIAAEKAGIIKEGVPVVVLDEDNGAFSVIRKKAERKNSHIYRIRSEKITFLKKTENKIDFSINSSYYKDSPLCITDTADYQIYNAALAAVAARVLLPGLKHEVLQKGLLAMRWEGRMEEVLPDVYVDGAHNPGAVEQICRTVAGKGGRWRLLFAVCGDKDYESMIRTLSDFPWQTIYITKMEGTRGADTEEILKCFRQTADAPCYVFEEAEQAFEAALHDKDNEGRLLCLGSLYLVGEIKRRRNIYFGK